MIRIEHIAPSVVKKVQMMLKKHSIKRVALSTDMSYYKIMCIKNGRFTTDEVIKEEKDEIFNWLDYPNGCY